MAAIRTLIVDDEPLARERVRKLLESDTEVEIIGECLNGKEAVKAIRAEHPDLVFLDVQMPELDGFGVLRKLSDVSLPSIIFVTAYDQYALKAFEVHALDYLLKPFDRRRFQKALQRAKNQIQMEKSSKISERLVDLLEELKAGANVPNRQKHLDRLVIKASGRVFFLRTDEIDWIESAGNYLRLHVGKEAHLLRDTMNALAARLDPQKFVRIHRSTMVNIDRTREIQTWFNGEYRLILEDGTKLNSSRGYRDQIYALLGKGP
ncbi:LytTR family DNA-binding domain-containing protein [bacterium]|nr:LytTR family DNA-binding domain-containing protein [bacterium]